MSKTCMNHSLIGLALLCAGSLTAAPGELSLTGQANMMVEIAFQAERAYADPFNEISEDVIFTDPKGVEIRVPAFWDGGSVWKVRYASPMVGQHRFRSESSQHLDRGLHGITGTIEISPYVGNNPLYLHGPLRVAPNKRHLEYLDHTPFFWLADTWWMGLCHRLEWPAEFKELAADRKAKGFNVIQIVAGLYPDMFPFDPRGANEAGFPWETNYTRIRPEYFKAADQRLGFLVDQGFTPCIVGAWGYFMPWMGVDNMKKHWRYLIARYSAWPVVWCAAGEANLPWYLAPGFPYDDRKQVHEWTEVMRYLRATDPFHRLLTVHPTAIKRFTARYATDDEGLLDFDLLQTSHGQSESVSMTINTVRESFAATPRMPVIDGEACYEMLGDSLPTQWTRRMFWLCLMNGAAGHTYGANGIWQCNRPGQPHGPSPHGGSYGKIPWNEAMHLPGSGQLGLAKAFFERYPWTKFEPHPDWIAEKVEPALDITGARWIWFPEGEPAKSAPAERRFFRCNFVLKPGQKATRARLRVSADDWCAMTLNGQSLGVCEDWHYGHQFDAIAPWLRPGTNTLSIVAQNKPTSLPQNPAGLLACLEVDLESGNPVRVITDSSWRCSKTEAPSWSDSGFDDRSWPTALVVGKYGDGPWGKLGDRKDAVSRPQATGMPGSLYLFYVPEREQLSMHHLAAQERYKGTIFDPVTGQTTALGMLTTDSHGACECMPPSSVQQDWVLVLEK